ncbi:MAG: response regulator [Imperialibacter sp.]|uniref:response regulator n=1 Tax=Imperialibacter sp. TaxID=2038411 RepID=UPI003A86C9B4
MKLSYKILWLDDKIEEFIEDEIISEIEDFLRESGFKPEITALDNTQEFLASVDDSFDLILTDYHLNDSNGHEIIKTIRGQDHSVMSEILFYTAQADLADTDRINRVSFLETNTLLGDHKDLVLQAVKSLIGLTIKKFQHIVAMRGMIMHETSSLDQTTLQIVNSFFEANQNDEVINLIFDSIIAFHQEKLHKVESFKKKSRVDKVLSDPVMFSSHQRADAVGNILRLRGQEDFIADFKAEVINIRNQFAHAVLEIDENGREFFRNKAEGITFDDELCKKIRIDINKHRINLDRVIAQLKG